MDLLGASLVAFLAISGLEFLVNMTYNENAASSGGILLIYSRRSAGIKSLLPNALSLADFNPYGISCVSNGFILIRDYILPLTLAGNN